MGFVGIAATTIDFEKLEYEPVDQFKEIGRFVVLYDSCTQLRISSEFRGIVLEDGHSKVVSED